MPWEAHQRKMKFAWYTILVSHNVIFDKMEGNFRKIRLLLKASPSLIDRHSAKDEFIEVFLKSKVRDTHRILSRHKGCDEKHLWLFCGDSVIVGDVNEQLRWSHLPGLFLNPTVFYFIRKGRPRALAHMCMAELNTLRGKFWQEIISLGWNPDARNLTIAESDYLRIAAIVVLLQDGEKHQILGLQKAVWRYLVFVRMVKSPSVQLVQELTGQVLNRARQNAAKQIDSKNNGLSNQAGKIVVDEKAGKKVHWDSSRPSSSTERLDKGRLARLDKGRRNLRRGWPLHNLLVTNGQPSPPSSSITELPDPPAG